MIKDFENFIHIEIDILVKMLLMQAFLVSPFGLAPTSSVGSAPSSFVGTLTVNIDIITEKWQQNFKGLEFFDSSEAGRSMAVLLYYHH